VRDEDPPEHVAETFDGIVGYPMPIKLIAEPHPQALVPPAERRSVTLDQAASLDGMAQRTDTFDVGQLGLSSGEGRSLDLEVPVDAFDFGGQRYELEEGAVDAHLDVSHTVRGYAFRLRFEAGLEGPCVRCLETADQGVDVDAREIDQPGGGEELSSPYFDEGHLDMRAWARDALALALPTQIVCKADCAGLCGICGENLNRSPDHAHEREPDPRWAALRELKLD
jgi:uncharacterized protein